MTVARDYVLHGVGHGHDGAALNVQYQGRFDPGLLRPFIETDPNSPDRGRPCAEIFDGVVYNNQTGKYVRRKKKYRIDALQARGINSPVFNATTLTRDVWIEIDKAVERARRLRLTAWADLAAANRKGGFDAWSKLTYEYYTITDRMEAVKDMDATAPGRDDLPLHEIRSVPLPVIHSDASFPQRFLDVTRAAGMPVDTEAIEQGTRRMWEMVEKTLIGTETGLTYGTRSTGPFPHTGTSTEYGYTTFPYRVTKTDLTTPTGSNPEAVVQDVMEMMETMFGNGYYGPFVLYHSTPYSLYFNSDYFRSGSTSAVRTVRERLMELEGLSDIRRLDYLTTGYQLILVDLNAGQFAAIDGMMPTTVQWADRGGYVQKLMTLMIQVPLLRAPGNEISGLVHATTS